MIVYDDVATLEKIKVFDARVERPPHYDSFAEFHYSYHYGDVYTPYVKQEEPLKVNYRGIDVYKLSQWTQGPALLQALN